MWSRLALLILSTISLMGCSYNSAYPPTQTQQNPACNPDYQHCPGNHKQEISQQINQAL